MDVDVVGVVVVVDKVVVGWIVVEELLEDSLVAVAVEVDCVVVVSDVGCAVVVVVWVAAVVGVVLCVVGVAASAALSGRTTAAASNANVDLAGPWMSIWSEMTREERQTFPGSGVASKHHQP